jgi:Trk K+ transport system NAD-binding subunit
LTLDDEVNVEVLKIAKNHKISRLSSIVNNKANLKEYKELDVELVDPDILIARRFEHILEPRRVVSQAFAGGRAEAIELEVNADSPVRGVGVIQGCTLRPRRRRCRTHVSHLHSFAVWQYAAL